MLPSSSLRRHGVERVKDRSLAKVDIHTVRFSESLTGPVCIHRTIYDSDTVWLEWSLKSLLSGIPHLGWLAARYAHSPPIPQSLSHTGSDAI